MFDNIPHEMRQYRQWITWRFEDIDAPKPSKVPYNPATGYMASVTNPGHWCTYDEALAAVQEQRCPIGVEDNRFDNVRPYSGLGFVLTRDDPYTIADLDDTTGNPEALEQQMKIFRAFDSYSERSPSKTGLHIIVRAAIPSGRRRNKVELYYDKRFMTMTGDVFEAKPVADRQPLVSQLWHEMGKDGGAVMYDGNAPQREEDFAVIDRAMRAANGAKFYGLHTGNWQQYYGSQSEADFAYVDMLAFYTQNREQLHRLFLASALGQRDKANREDYRNYMINKSFDRLLPPLNFDAIYNAIEAKLAEVNAVKPEPVAEPGPVQFSADVPPLPVSMPPTSVTVQLPPPPGLLGELAQYIFRSAVRPVPEIALAGAIGLMAGICGRAWNVSGTGLNQYVLLLAPTGRGKEAMATAISRITTCMTLDKASPHFVELFGNFVGPSEIASGQGLIKSLSKRPFASFVSIVGEFGLRFRQLADERASSAELSLLRALLDLFNKSGRGNILGSSAYADDAKNAAEVKAPAYSVLAECVPESFYGHLDEGMIANGLLPRFTIIEYNGARPARNEFADQVMPDDNLLQRLKKLADGAIFMNGQNAAIDVSYTPEALAYLNEFDIVCDAQINGATKAVVHELWNRAHLKVLKLAALIAVGCNQFTPTIDMEAAVWARTQVENDIRRLLQRFAEGSIGTLDLSTDEHRQAAAVLEKIVAYTAKPYNALPASFKLDEQMHRDHVVPFTYISKSLTQTAAFKKDKRGAAVAINRAIQTLLDSGDIRSCSPKELLDTYVYSGKAYALTNVRHLS